MDDSAAKTNLHSYLRHERAAVLAKLDGLSEYDVRRPMTTTGTNLLGLVKHLATWEARYLGEVFGRPFPEPLPRWDVEEDLSQLIGDIAAHRLVDTGRRFGAEGRETLERAGGNLIEFVTEERPLLVPRAALPGFAADIAALRDAVGRLDKRLARIERGAAAR